MDAPWVKSSFSFANGNCVEVAELPGDSVGIRDSRDPGGPVLRFTRGEWAAFLGGARRRELEALSGIAAAATTPATEPRGTAASRCSMTVRHNEAATCRSYRTPRS